MMKIYAKCKNYNLCVVCVLIYNLGSFTYVERFKL